MFTPEERLQRARDRSREWHRNHKEHLRTYYRKWYAENGRNRATDYIEAIYEWEKNNPEKVKAHDAVRRAIKRGELIKPFKCSKCYMETRVSGHHEDYTRPLEVLWLCSSCHKALHSKVK